jgi:hypothetical protein
MTATLQLPRPVIDPSVVEIADMWFESGTETTGLEWLAQLDDCAALLELENRLAPISRYMAPEDRFYPYFTGPVNRFWPYFTGPVNRFWPY